MLLEGAAQKLWELGSIGRMGPNQTGPLVIGRETWTDVEALSGMWAGLVPSEGCEGESVL